MNLKRLRELQEAEGSYGQTPKARSRYSALAAKGNKTASKHAERTDTRESPTERMRRVERTGMTQDDRNRRRGAYEYGSDAYDPEEMDPPSGPGGMPKGKKLTRQRKTGVSAESYNIYDILISHLLDEGYADDVKNAYCIIENMSENWVFKILDEVL